MDNVPATILCFERASIELLDVFLITRNVDSLELRISRDLIKLGVFVLCIILLSFLSVRYERMDYRKNLKNSRIY